MSLTYSLGVSNNIITIAAVVGGVGGLLCLITIIIIGCCCRRKLQRSQVELVGVAPESVIEDENRSIPVIHIAGAAVEYQDQSAAVKIGASAINHINY